MSRECYVCGTDQVVEKYRLFHKSSVVSRKEVWTCESCKRDVLDPNRAEYGWIEKEEYERNFGTYGR